MTKFLINVASSTNLGNPRTFLINNTVFFVSFQYPWLDICSSEQDLMYAQHMVSSKLKETQPQ